MKNLNGVIAAAAVALVNVAAVVVAVIIDVVIGNDAIVVFKCVYISFSVTIQGT